MLGLGALLMVTLLAIVFVRAESRMAYAELHQLDKERDELGVEYGRLLLERATWSLNHLVEREAQNQLSMSRPDPERVVTLLVEAE